MYRNEAAKRAYFQNRYKKQKDKYKKNQENYWINKTKTILGKDDVTDEEVKECRNNYYREYRKNHQEEIKNIEDNFWNKQSENLEEA